MGCYPRKIIAQQYCSRQQLSDDFRRWSRHIVVGYGHRWRMAETVFSAMKRMFGEYDMARNYQNMVKEMYLKASLYNMFTGMKL
jgi:hypothetical protein